MQMITPKEELKLIKEPKNHGDDSIKITATAVRIPVQGGHSESVNIEFENDFDLEEVKNILANTPGVVLQDDVENKVYPMCFYSEGKDRSFRRKNKKRPFSAKHSELLDCSRQSEKRRRNERGTNRRISHCKPISIKKQHPAKSGIFIRTFKLLKLNTWKSLPSIKQTKIYFPEKCSHSRCHFIHRKTDCMASYQF